MKEVAKKRGPNSNQPKRVIKSEKKDHKVQEKNGSRTIKVKETEFKASSKPDSCLPISDSNTGAEPSEVYESMVVHYMDDVNRSEDTSQDSKANGMVVVESKDRLKDESSDLEDEGKEGTDGESDLETNDDSVSSQGDSQTADDEKGERASKASSSLAKTDSSPSFSHVPKVKSESKQYNSQRKTSKESQNKSTTPKKVPSVVTTKGTTDSSKSMKVHPKPLSDSSEGVDDKSLREVKEADFLDEVSISVRSAGSDDETVTIEDNDEHKERVAVDRKIEEMEMRIEKLEEELREVAALEIALYSVVPEHGSSAHKVHTPARRLSRLYFHACKYWSPDRRATVARNAVSGLVLVAKSCANDVSRLTFWLSNIVVLREIISQAFGSSCQSSSLIRMHDSNGGGKKSEAKPSPLKWKSNSGSRQPNKFMQFVDDWQETRTLTAAFEKIESWIFSRIVESIWWQTLTPNMQPPAVDSVSNKAIGKLFGPSLGDQQQGSLSINLWKNAFQDAFKRLCPVRAGGHECGCLPVLARKVMEQCVGRLDVAMFNAILRESAHEIPTDPVSDPIVDSKVLPIPAGDLSFGSGAQLKNSVGSWSRWLTDILGMVTDDTAKDDGTRSEHDDRQGDEAKCFLLLNELSDLLMLPKDMLMDRSIRMEVCPSISLQLVKRILCNFSPDEFCPDSVPGAVLEALNAECIIDRRLSSDTASSFPYTAAPIVYTPPSSADIAERIAETGGKSQLSRNASIIQKKGYTSDEELQELDSPLTSVINTLSLSPTMSPNGNGNTKHKDDDGTVVSNTRFELLREVWLAT